MKRFPMFSIFASLAIVAVLACGAFAANATPNHYHIKVIPRTHTENGVPPVTPALDGVAQWFGFSPYTQTSNPFSNTDGTELWPCFGSYDGTNSSTANPDCIVVGNPHEFLPAGAIVVGSPNYTWSLADCNATSTTAGPCGQTTTWYEDNTGDATDDLTYLIEATQGTSVIADSGTVDFGPNTFGGLGFPVDVVIYGDQNFGNDGIATGPNNGNCEADFNYPLGSPANPGAVYVVQANKTCVPAVAGKTKLTATTSVSTPAYIESHSAAVCAPFGPPPCWTVKYTVKYKVIQTWYIDLE